MRNLMTVTNEENEDLEIEILIGFQIDSIGKEYIAYTINDDCISETVPVAISEIEYENGKPKIVPIKDEEKEMVLMFYNSIRKA